jgi:hypothetical protein
MDIPPDPVFEDEAPDAADRARILKALAWGKQLNGGLVDVTSGLVYKYSMNMWVRLGSLAGIVLGLVGSVLLIWAIGNGFWLDIDGWPYKPENVPTLIGAWAALLAGILVHIGVGAAKRAQSRDQLPSVFAPADFLARIDAQFGFILYKLFLALIGLFGLVGLLGLPQATAFNAFLTGYSLDSIIELVGSALDRQSTSRIGALKKQLGISGE